MLARSVAGYRSFCCVANALCENVLSGCLSGSYGPWELNFPPKGARSPGARSKSMAALVYSWRGHNRGGVPLGVPHKVGGVTRRAYQKPWCMSPKRGPRANQPSGSRPHGVNGRSLVGRQPRSMRGKSPELKGAGRVVGPPPKVVLVQGIVSP